MATAAPITGAPRRAPILRPLPLHRRLTIEAEIEQHLHRVTLLIARLDRAEGDIDFEDDDPAGGDPLDSMEGPGDLRGGCSDDGGYCYGLLPDRPVYATDQTAGPINYEKAERAERARRTGLIRPRSGGWTIRR